MAADRAGSVLMTADTVGGVWTYAVELSRALIAQGLRVHLATLGAPLRGNQRAAVQDLAGLSLHESAWRLEWMPAPWDDVRRSGEWLLALERDLHPDVVHLNQYAYGALPFAAPTLVVAHSCVPTWWRAVHGTAAPREWDTYRDVVASGLRGADLVVAPTAAMLKALRDEHGWHGRARVVPNARDPRLFTPGTKRDIVFAAGRFWDEAKNLAALEAVAADLTWPVRVAGSCRAPDGRTGRPRNVVPLGELPPHEVAREMASAAIYALPARYEPFGLSVLEAALSGCALVLGDIASLRENWRDAALFVAPDDHAALRATVDELIADRSLRERLAHAARERALHFHPQRMAQSYLDAYAALPATRTTHRREDAACA